MKLLFGLVVLIASFNLHVSACDDDKCDNPVSISNNVVINKGCCDKVCPEEPCHKDGVCKPNYSWRDFNGDFAEGDFVAGTDASGQPVYVGQTFFPQYELLPAHISSDTGIAQSTAYQNVLNTTQNVKILTLPKKCQKYLRWVRTDVNSMDSLFQNYKVVKGGYETSKPLYVGRILQDNGQVVGKFFGVLTANPGLAVARNGAVVNYKIFEALVYDCNVK